MRERKKERTRYAFDWYKKRQKLKWYEKKITSCNFQQHFFHSFTLTSRTTPVSYHWNCEVVLKYKYLNRIDKHHFTHMPHNTCRFSHDLVLRSLFSSLFKMPLTRKLFLWRIRCWVAVGEPSEPEPGASWFSLLRTLFFRRIWGRKQRGEGG